MRTLRNLSLVVMCVLFVNQQAAPVLAGCGAMDSYGFTGEGGCPADTSSCGLWCQNCGKSWTGGYECGSPYWQQNCLNGQGCYEVMITCYCENPS
jgi:hypothetical protein